MDGSSPRVGIVGLGLIGGSLARDLLAHHVEVIAFDRQAHRLRALRDPALSRVRLVSTVAEVAVAGTVVIAVPVAAALTVLEALAPAIGSAQLVMDVGGTKAAIAACAEALGIGDRFVGCHPLAGDHRSGWDASRPGLFADAPVFVCPSPSTDGEHVLAAERFWRQVGARPVCMAPEAHDRRLAFTSHLPHLLAAALARTLQSVGVARAELGPGGRDMTRLAASSPELWRDIALQNAGAISDALEAFETRIRSLRNAVEARDAARVTACLAEARDWC